MYFASVGKVELARACAERAHGLVCELRPGSEEARARDDLEYGDRGGMSLLRRQLEQYLASQSHLGPAKQLRTASVVWCPRFFAQFGLIVAVVASLATWGAVSSARLAAQEQVRLERAGIERAAAAAMVAQQAAELRKQEQPLPPSGVYMANASVAKVSTTNQPPFKVITAAGRHYFVKLYDWGTNNLVLSMFVRGGEEITVGVPAGTYQVRLASGLTWYGEKIRFGPSTSYSVADVPFAFSVVGRQLNGHALTLVNVVNGNLHQTTIDPAQF